MEDIAPELLEKIRQSFEEMLEKSKPIQTLYQAIVAGTATYSDAEEYAYLVGEALSQAFGKHLSSAVLPDGKMYFNIADRVLRPMLEADHEMVANAAAAVQQVLNRTAGIGLKPQTVAVNQDRIDGIINRISSADSFDDVAWVLGTPVVLFSQNVVDETLRRNVVFQGKAGLTPKIIRKAERKCCEWCRSLAGEYDYPNVPDDIYRRHENCRCTVEYDPADGKRRRQNVYTKKWTDEAPYDTLEARRNAGRKSILLDLVQHPKKLASYTPADLVAKLEAAGFEVKPLMRGSFKGIPFEKGGGFKVNFEDGGLFQYHPAERSHHGGAYYKISTGKGGIKRYELDGTEKKD